MTHNDDHKKFEAFARADNEGRAADDLPAVVERLTEEARFLAAGQGAHTVGARKKLAADLRAILTDLRDAQAENERLAGKIIDARNVLDAFGDLGMDPGLWRALTTELPSAHVALELIDQALNPEPAK